MYAEQELSRGSSVTDYQSMCSPSKREAAREDYSPAETVIMEAPPKIFEEVKQTLMFRCPEDR